MNIAVLKAYSELFDFAGNEFDQALRYNIYLKKKLFDNLFICFLPFHRAYLKTFRLPGEAQKIDRMMEAFAQRFYSQNTESVFASSGIFFIYF